LSSPNLAQYAVQQGWAKSVDNFNFGAAYNDFFRTTLIKGRQRRAVTMAALSAGKGKIDVPYMMNILRKHAPDGGSGKNWQPQNNPLLGTDVCMHGSYGIIRDSNSAGSLVVHLDKKNPTIFVTGTASPCTSLFKPVWMDASLLDIGPARPMSMIPTPCFGHTTLHRATVQIISAHRILSR
jgi:hypothetical protein